MQNEVKENYIDDYGISEEEAYGAMVCKAQTNYNEQKQTLRFYDFLEDILKSHNVSMSNIERIIHDFDSLIYDFFICNFMIDSRESSFEVKRILCKNNVSKEDAENIVNEIYS